tara:strand:- start:6970 stop:7338 length:369 start_codon:yes stop_codon:yes gene_type:complete
MGIKRRILRSPKYRYLKANRFPRTVKKEEAHTEPVEAQATLEALPAPKTPALTIATEELAPSVTVEEVELVSAAPEQIPVEKPKPKPKPKATKAKAKLATKKKTTVKKTTRKPKATTKIKTA